MHDAKIRWVGFALWAALACAGCSDDNGASPGPGGGTCDPQGNLWMSDCSSGCGPVMACFASCPSCSDSCKLGCSSNADCERYGAGTCKSASCSSCRRVCSRAPTTCGTEPAGSEDGGTSSEEDSAPAPDEGCSYEVQKTSQCTGTPPEVDDWIAECVNSPTSCSAADTDSFPAKYCVGSCCTTFVYRNFRSISICP